MSADPRSIERLRHHFEVERELAQKMRQSTREDRSQLFKLLYTELFQRVPDHPRLTRRENPVESAKNVQSQLKLLKESLRPNSVFLEFAPGDCRLAHAVCDKVKNVIGVDISDQRAAPEESPPNFQLVVYDGYKLDLPDACADVLFSYQFLEHLHPDDIDPHFAMARRLLKPGGVYVLDTPHRYSGPHDVSRHFSDHCECFHFQEWTYREMLRLLRKHGFHPCYIFRFGRIQKNPMMTAGFLMVEAALHVLPRSIQRKLASRLFPSVTLVATRA